MIKSKSKMIEGSYNRFVGCQREQICGTNFFFILFQYKTIVFVI
jgi:hypothetical protein